MSADKKLISAKTFSKRLLEWFDQHGRKDLPWQINKTPYRVWVSEIMLQQTQVSAVVDYYTRFMKRFPELSSLASADQDEVLEYWAGLGYYARGRNLHKCAQIIANELKGVFPDTTEELAALPGIGRSTAGAIISIAHRKPASILDGNVKRVLCRIDAIQSWSGERETEKKLWQRSEELTPTKRTDDYTQAIMDLGATLCTRSKPKCDTCPFSKDCLAKQLDLVSQLPKSKPKKAIPLKHTWALEMISSEGALLLEKRPDTGIWGGLYSLPELDFTLSFDEAIYEVQRKFKVGITQTTRESPLTHTFSHYKLEIHPIRLIVHKSDIELHEANQWHWVETENLDSLGLPAPIKKYLNTSERQGTLPLD